MDIEQANQQLFAAIKQTVIERFVRPATEEQIEAVKAAINAGADVNARTEEGNTPLHLAAARGLVEIADILIRKGADVNAESNRDKSTPLHWAAAEERIGVIRVLCDHGANTNAKDYKGKTPSDWALANERPDAVHSIATCAARQQRNNTVASRQ